MTVTGEILVETIIYLSIILDDRLETFGLVEVLCGSIPKFEDCVEWKKERTLNISLIAVDALRRANHSEFGKNDGRIHLPLAL